jgi:flagellar hook-basal body complex protein FliE
MRVEPLLPDTAALSVPGAADAHGFTRTLDALAGLFNEANAAEDAFAAGGGSLQDAMYERARADVALSVATATAQRIAQSLQAVLNMQI